MSRGRAIDRRPSPRGAAGALIAILALVLPLTSPGQAPVDPAPLKATLFFKDPPPRAAYAPQAPITVILQVETTEPVVTVDWFSRDEMRRYLVLTGPDGARSAPAAAVLFHRHVEAVSFNCYSPTRSPGGVAIRVSPTETLAGPADPEPFVLEFVVDDLREIFDLGSGLHTLTARIPFVAFGPDSIIADCRSLSGDMADIVRGTPFTIVSNSVEFVNSLLTFGGFGKPLVDDTTCPEIPCRRFRLGSTIPVKFKLPDDTSPPPAASEIGIGVTQVAGSNPLQPFTTLGTFRSGGGQGNYIFNLKTKGLAPGTWRIDATFPDGAVRSVHFGLR